MRASTGPQTPTPAFSPERILKRYSFDAGDRLTVSTCDRAPVQEADTAGGRAQSDVGHRGTGAATRLVGFLNRPFGLPDLRASPTPCGSTVWPDTLPPPDAISAAPTRLRGSFGGPGADPS